jgi:hypothetical protein
MQRRGDSDFDVVMVWKSDWIGSTAFANGVCYSRVRDPGGLQCSATRLLARPRVSIVHLHLSLQPFVFYSSTPNSPNSIVQWLLLPRLITVSEVRICNITPASSCRSSPGLVFLRIRTTSRPLALYLVSNYVGAASRGFQVDLSLTSSTFPLLSLNNELYSNSTAVKDIAGNMSQKTLITHHQQEKLKKKLAVSNFEPNAILRGAQLTIVGGKDWRNDVKIHQTDLRFSSSSTPKSQAFYI